jgi:CRP-like cAMP-binding protein
MPSRIELLQRMPVFGALRDDTLALLLQLSRRIEVAAGECFFREGETNGAMYVLEAGRVLVIKHWQGHDYVLHELAAGDCFGEMALMDLAPRSATVRAETACQAIALEADDLLQLFERDPEQFALVQMNIGREVCRRLRATDELLFRHRMGDATAVPEALFRRA